MSAYHVVSLSGGKDSTAMLIMMLERGMPVDEVVWFDTGWEFPAMVGHIGKVEAETGVPVTRLRPDLPFNYWMFDHVRMKGARAGEAGYGWARMGSRWCTKIKTSAIDRHVKAMAGRRRVVQYVGIAADEAHRAKGKRYPLVEWGVTEAEALAYCRARGYDWGGLYDRFDRVSCWCCPLQRLSDLRELRRSFPDLWELLRGMDARLERLPHRLHGRAARATVRLRGLPDHRPRLHRRARSNGTTGERRRVRKRGVYCLGKARRLGETGNRPNGSIHKRVIHEKEKERWSMDVKDIRGCVKLVWDSERLDEDVEPTAEPEPDWS